MKICFCCVTITTDLILRAVAASRVTLNEFILHPKVREEMWFESFSQGGRECARNERERGSQMSTRKKICAKGCLTAVQAWLCENLFKLTGLWRALSPFQMPLKTFCDRLCFSLTPIISLVFWLKCQSRLSSRPSSSLRPPVTPSHEWLLLMPESWSSFLVSRRLSWLEWKMLFLSAVPSWLMWMPRRFDSFYNNSPLGFKSWWTGSFGPFEIETVEFFNKRKTSAEQQHWRSN